MIKKLHLKNFKCFEEQELVFAPLTLLTGLNGMGKSTAIQSLLLLRQSWERHQSLSYLDLNGSYVNIGTAKDALYQYFKDKHIGIGVEYEPDIRVEGEIGECSMIYEWEIKHLSDSMLKVQKQDIQNPNKDEIWLARIFSTSFHYLNAERVGPRTSYGFNKHPFNPLGNFGEHAAQYFAKHYDDEISLPQLKHPKEKDNRLFMQVNAWLGDIRPGTSVNARMFDSLDLASLEFRLDKGQNQFRPTNVGFGLSYTLPILVALLTATSSTCIILENPEAHLHPAGQAAIGRLLAFAAAAGVQIMVETHSDHLLNGVRIATKQFGFVQPEHTAILYFTGADNGSFFEHFILTPKLDKNGKLDFWPKGFFDEYAKQLSQL